MDTGTNMANKKAKTSSDLDRLALLKVVKNSTLLSQREKDVWTALYRLGPSTGQEVDQEIGAVGCASSRLIELERRHMVKRLGRRYCTVSGKSAALWGVTANPPSAITRIRRTSPSPTNGELKAFVNLVRISLAEANRRGVRVAAETKRILKWLEDGAPCVHQKLENQQSASNKKSNRA